MKLIVHTILRSRHQQTTLFIIRLERFFQLRTPASIMASATNNNGEDSTPVIDNRDCVSVKKDPWLPSPPPLQPQVVPSSRIPWQTGLTECWGRYDHFSSIDHEICMLGCLAPCVLHGSNVDRLGSGRWAGHEFSGQCSAYLCLCLIGVNFGGLNLLAPLLSFNHRSNLRRRFNLEGSCESLVRICGCCQCFVEDDSRRERCETDCDLFTHMVCHPCALCQEGRELRRRIPLPPLINHTDFVASPPPEQTMV